MMMRKLIDVEVEMILNHGAAITDRQTTLVVRLLSQLKMHL